MSPDPKVFNRAPKARTAREIEYYGPCDGRRLAQTHDEACAVKEQCWRLMCWAEPSLKAPAPALRYGPYNN